ncbi:FxsA family protein [Pelagibacteraceae bacterium]|nr:FxsA family protein [Pelagibacteraceae bacterium]
MNSFFLLFIGLPALEIFLMIKVGAKIGALNTIFLIFFTATIGVYFAKMEGIKTIRSGLTNLYKNQVPINEIISGASIALAALFLIIPGFFTDALGFLLLIPLTRKILIRFFIKKNSSSTKKSDSKILDGEIIEDKENEL